MRHRVKGRHLGRTAEHRRALFRNLAAALFEHGRIRTTDAKAREVRPLAEKMITLAKRGDLHARRQAARVVGKSPALERLFGPIAERFAERPGGYTRVIKAGRRLGDGAPIAYLELVDEAPRPARAGAGEEEKGREGRAGARGREGRGSRTRGEGPAKAKGEGRASRAKPEARGSKAGEESRGSTAKGERGGGGTAAEARGSEKSGRKKGAQASK